VLQGMYYLSTANLNVRLHSGLTCRWMLRCDTCCEPLGCERKNRIDAHKAVTSACVKMAYEICIS